jgi:hypothetical protein
MQERLKLILNPWYESLEEPIRSQGLALKKILDGYKQTSYGLERNAGEISSIKDFRENFTVVTFECLKPYIEKVKQGNFREILPDMPIEWANPRGGETFFPPINSQQVFGGSINKAFTFSDILMFIYI